MSSYLLHISMNFVVLMLLFSFLCLCVCDTPPDGQAASSVCFGLYHLSVPPSSPLLVCCSGPLPLLHRPLWWKPNRTSWRLMVSRPITALLSSLLLINFLSRSHTSLPHPHSYGKWQPRLLEPGACLCWKVYECFVAVQRWFVRRVGGVCLPGGAGGTAPRCGAGVRCPLPGCGSAGVCLSAASLCISASLLYNLNQSHTLCQVFRACSGTFTVLHSTLSNDIFYLFFCLWFSPLWLRVNVCFSLVTFACLHNFAACKQLCSACTSIMLANLECKLSFNVTGNGPLAIVNDLLFSPLFLWVVASFKPLL